MKNASVQDMLTYLSATWARPHTSFSWFWYDKVSGNIYNKLRRNINNKKGCRNKSQPKNCIVRGKGGSPNLFGVWNLYTTWNLIFFQLVDTKGPNLVIDIIQHTANQPKSIGWDTIVNLPSVLYYCFFGQISFLYKSLIHLIPWRRLEDLKIYNLLSQASQITLGTTLLMLCNLFIALQF